MAPGKVAVLMLTPACQMHCPFCGAEEGFESMDWAKALGLLDQLEAGGFASVVLGGGEPLLWAGGAAALAQAARQRGLLAQVGSNGLLAPSTEEGLRAFDRWVLPLESLEDGPHASMRPWTRPHARVILDLLQRLRLAGIEATISTVATAENLAGLEGLAAWLRDYQAQGLRLHAWHLYNFLPQGRGGEANAARFGIDKADFLARGQALRRLAAPLTVYLRPDMYHSKTVSFFLQKSGSIQRLGALAPH